MENSQTYNDRKQISNSQGRRLSAKVIENFSGDDEM
jgi:hypothetical protein